MKKEIEEREGVEKKKVTEQLKQKAESLRLKFKELQEKIINRQKEIQ